MRRVWIGLGILLVLLIAGVVGLNLWVHAYLRSDAFRGLVSAKTGAALRANADYQPLDWSGSSVFSPSLTARGESGTPLETFDAEQVRADVDWKAVFQGAWRVDRVDVVRLDVRIRSERQQAETAAQSGPTPDPIPPKHGWLPNRFELGRVSVQNANISIDGGAQVRSIAFTTHPEGSGWIVDGSGGKLMLPSCPLLDIDSLRVRWQQGVVYLTNTGLRLGENGTISASGEVGGPTGPFDLQFDWQNIDSTNLLDAEWRKRLSGVLAGKAHSVGRVGKSPMTTGSFRLIDGQLKGLPIQKEIAKFTRSPQFERMPLQEVSGDFAYDGANTVVKNFVGESQGLFRIEGESQIGGNGSLRGEFRVGVTSQSLQWLPGSQEKVFTTSENGYLWTTVTVGGTIQNPTENLSGRLAQAMGEQVIDTGVEVIRSVPPNAVDAVQKAVDILSPLIP